MNISLELINKKTLNQLALIAHYLSEGEIEKSRKLVDELSMMLWRFEKLQEDLQVSEIK